MVYGILAMEHILSQVSSMPGKLIRQFLPWTSSAMSFHFLSATSSFCSSAQLTSKTQLLIPSEVSLVPWVLITSIFPVFLTSNEAGASTSQQSSWEMDQPLLPCCYLSSGTGWLPWCCLECPKGLFFVYQYRQMAQSVFCLFVFPLFWVLDNKQSTWVPFGLTVHFSAGQPPFQSRWDSPCGRVRLCWTRSDCSLSPAPGPLMLCTVG